MPRQTIVVYIQYVAKSHAYVRKQEKNDSLPSMDCLFVFLSPHSVRVKKFRVRVSARADSPCSSRASEYHRGNLDRGCVPSLPFPFRPLPCAAAYCSRDLLCGFASLSLLRHAAAATLHCTPAVRVASLVSHE